ncbi:MAG: pyruvate dehydrogenase (acetyl-transferring) E1 component subunit alpha [Myxococcota bacterium]
MSDQDALLSFYRSMMVIRRFEEEAARAYAQGKIGGFLHLYIGQEDIAVAAASCIDVGRDYVFASYRDHGIALALGMEPKAAMAELFGKHTGCARGLGGSMHFFDLERGFLGGWAIVGGHLPLAAGTGFKSRYLGEDRVTLCFFGEGATNIAGFHEGLSLAGLWKLPVVFVCENNRYAMGTPMHRTSPLKDLTLKAQGYGMPGENFEAGDVLRVRERMAAAVDRARRGEGPSFLEIRTYRFRGHSISDPAKYRTREELDEQKRRDPIRQARQALLEGGLPEDRLDDVDEEVDGLIDEAVRFADGSEPAREETMWSSVLAPSEGE